MKEGEFRGIIRNIKRMCGLYQEPDREKIPVWFQDNNGILAANMSWQKWLEFCEFAEQVLDRQPAEVKEKEDVTGEAAF